MLSKQLQIAVHLLATQLIQESPVCLLLLLIFRENQKCNCNFKENKFLKAKEKQQLQRGHYCFVSCYKTLNKWKC